MTTPTSPWNIPLFAPGDTIPSLEGVLNSISTGLNTALNSLQLQTTPQVASAAARNALFPSPTQGNTVYRTDLMLPQMYFGVYNSSTNKFGRRVAGWYPMPNGSAPVLVAPTGGSPVVVTGTGAAFTNDESCHIRATSATSVQINGIFLPGVRRHVIHYDVSASGGNFVAMQLCTAGTAHTGGGDYIRQYSGISNTTQNAGGGTDSGLVVGGASGTYPTMATVDIVGASDNPLTFAAISGYGASEKTTIPETFTIGGTTNYGSVDNDGFKLMLRDTSILANWNIWVEAVF